MEILKQLGSLVEQATGDQHQEPPLELYGKILTIVHTRVDMYLLFDSGLNMSSMQSPKGSYSRTKECSANASIYYSISLSTVNCPFTLKSQPKSFFLKSLHYSWIKMQIEKSKPRFFGLLRSGRNFSDHMTIFFLCFSSSTLKFWKKNFPFRKITCLLTSLKTLIKKEKNNNNKNDNNKQRLAAKDKK